MPRVHVTDFVAHDTRKFRLISQIGKNSASDIYVSAWNRKRVHDRRVHNREMPLEIGPMRDTDELASYRSDVCLQCLRLGDTVFLADLSIGLLPHRNLLRFRHQ